MKKIIILLAITHCINQDLTAQKKFVDSLLSWINTHPKIDSQYIQTLHRVSYRLSETDVKKSYEYYQKAAYYSDSINFTFGKSLAQINLGILFSNSANFDASNKAYFKAIEYAEACGALRLQAVSLNNLGDNFKILQDLTKCRQYTTEAISINTKLEAWRGVAINYELLQQCDLEEKLYGSAKNNLLTGMPFAIRAGESYILSQFYLGFAKLHAINNQTDSAIFYFTKALDESGKQGDLRNEYYVYLAQVQYFKKLKPDEKLGLLKKAMKIARHTGYFEGVSNAAKQLSLFYDEINNKDSSLAYYRIYRYTADSLFSENNLRNVTIKETEWMIKKKEMENRQLKEFTLLQNKELTLKNSWLLAMFICLLLTIAVAFIIYKSIENKKKRTELQLKQKISDTEMAALKAQMNPHFIFNCISSIDGLIQGNDKYNATVYLNKFAKLIRNILDNSKENTIQFSKDIETLQLYIDLEQMRSENKYRTRVHIADELLNSDYQVPPLVIQPFVENAIHHGLRNREDNNGLLVIGIERAEDNICYTISDNGIGRTTAATLNTHKHQSYGIKMGTERIKMFNEETIAAVKIEDLYDNEKAMGTKVTVKLKIK